jgi:hypothetical protein
MARSGTGAVARDRAYAVQGTSAKMGFDGRDPERDRATPALAASTRGACRGCEAQLLPLLPGKDGVLPNLLFNVRRSPATQGLFANVSMDRQYEMIDEAIERLLNIREGAEPTTLSRTRDAHRRFHLAPSDFDHFHEAFLEALVAMGERNPEVLDCWYAVLRPSLDYMKQACASKPRPKPVRTHKPSKHESAASPTCARPRTPSNAN